MGVQIKDVVPTAASVGATDWFVLQLAAGGAGSTKKVSGANLQSAVTAAAPLFLAKAATTAPITLSGSQTIDGVTLANGDAVLVKNQASHATNGLYAYNSAGAWTRLGLQTGNAFGAYLVSVPENGAVNFSTLWMQDSNVGVVGTDPQTFDVVAASNKFSISIDGTTSMCDGDVLAKFFSGIGGLDIAGVLRAASGSWEVDASGNIIACGTSVPLSGLITDVDGATITFNCITQDKHLVVLGGNRQLAVSNWTIGHGHVFLIQQPPSGGPYIPLLWTGTITWMTPGNAAPTFSTAASAVDTISAIKTGASTYLAYYNKGS